MRRPEYAIWSAISIFCVLVPAPLHWRTRNVANISVVIWLTLYNVINLINSFLWADHYRDRAPIWSDISCRITAIFLFAIPLCSLAQMQRLSAIIGPHAPFMASVQAQRRRLIEELIICIVLPLLMIPVLYCVQGHRYDIVENIGPVFPTVATWLSVLVQRLIPLLISIVSLFYGARAMTRFGTKRKENKEISLDARLTTSVYIRLLGNVACNCVVIMFLSLWYFINRVVTGNTVDGMPFTMNWGDTHAAFDLISQYAESSLTAQDMEFSNLVPFWVGILYGILFFLFWGFGQEAVNSYWAMWTKFRKVVGMPEKPLQDEEAPKPQLTLGSTAMTLSGIRRNDDYSRFGSGKRPNSFELQSTDEKTDLAARLGLGSSTGKANAPPSSGISVKVETSVVVDVVDVVDLPTRKTE